MGPSSSGVHHKLCQLQQQANKPHCGSGHTRRKWGKKVVFLVNKVDILADDGEVAEVVAFVADNAARLLGDRKSVV